VFQQLNPLAASQEEEEVDDEEMGVAETYADYMPSKCEYYALHSLPISAWWLTVLGLSFLSHGLDWKITGMDLVMPVALLSGSVTRHRASLCHRS
jgi:hypothetical protein